MAKFGRWVLLLAALNSVSAPVAVGAIGVALVVERLRRRALNPTGGPV